MRRGFYGLLWAAVLIVFVRGETGIRYAGGFLLILGGYAVLRGFFELRRSFDIPPIRVEVQTELMELWREFVVRLRRLLHLKGRPTTVMASAAGSIRLVGNATVSTTTNFDSALEMGARVTMLERRHQELEIKIAGVENRLIAELRSVEDNLRAEQAERAAVPTIIYTKMEGIMTGGLRFQIIGITWLFIGTLLTTAAPELEHWLYR
jgi:hypothetical protein